MQVSETAQQMSTTFTPREMALPSHRALAVQQLNSEQRLLASVAQWKAEVEQAREIFGRLIYNNPNVTPEMVRYHRADLVTFMAAGENLALQMMEVDPEEVDALDALVSQLSKEYVEWHAPPEARRGMPEAFRLSLLELQKNESPPAATPGRIAVDELRARGIRRSRAERNRSAQEAIAIATGGREDAGEDRR